MQDKMILQEEMADNICGLIYLFKSEDQSIGFLRSLLFTLSKEWPLIDRWRMDKFLLLVRRLFRTIFCHMRDLNWDDQLIQKYIAFFKDTTITASSKICDSLKSHCASVYLDELDYAGGLSESQTIEFLRPYAEVLKTSISDYLFRAVCEEVFDLILQQFSEELFESNYEEIGETNEGSAPERENDDDMEDESRHSDDEDESRESSEVAKNRDKTSIMFDHAKIAEMLFDVGKHPAVNARRRKRIYALMQKFETAAKGLDPAPVAQIEKIKKSLPKDEIVLAADKLLSMEVKQRKDTQKYKKSRNSTNDEIVNSESQSRAGHGSVIKPSKKRSKFSKKIKG
uniref:Uncharacterized protein n=1 Tax=Acrobeloides nanus TaxID=290746 RepID=A0A914DWX8_9BILA